MNTEVQTKEEEVIKTMNTDVKTTSVDNDNDNDENSTNSDKIPKKKYALMFGYLGTEYQGLQINKDCKTIEAEILRALHDAKLISDANYFDEFNVSKIQYMRAARTDKGVHAAGNCSHVKLLIKPDEEEIACNEINKFLPNDIRIFQLRKVARGFNAKNSCDRRRYEYILPISCLQAKNGQTIPSIEQELLDTWINYKEYKEKLSEGTTLDSLQKTKDDADKKEIYDQISMERVNMMMNYIHTYKYIPDQQDLMLGGCVPYEDCPVGTKEVVDRLRAALYLYKGSHRFHNYTVGKNSIDPRSIRTMYGFICSDPIRIRDHLYLRLCVEGQSFMLNQIRKMVGTAVEVTRGSMTLYHLFETMGKGTANLPTAPSTGLFLDYCIYELYNNKKDTKIKIDFTDDSIASIRYKYKTDVIYPHIDEEIYNEHIFETWLEELDRNYTGYPVTSIETKNIPVLEQSNKEKMDKIKQKKNESIARKKRYDDDTYNNKQINTTNDNENNQLEISQENNDNNDNNNNNDNDNMN